jgi:hypothetical protein
MNNLQQQENNVAIGEDADIKAKLEKLRQQWYHSCPSRLYDLCIQVLVKNVHTTLLVPSMPPKPASKSLMLQQQTQPETSGPAREEQLPVIAESTSMSKRTKIPQHSLVNNSFSSTIKPKSSAKSSSKRRKDKGNSEKTSRRHHIKTKYRLADHVGPLPAPICHSLIKEYSKYYLGQLEQLEREAFFDNFNAKSKHAEQLKVSQGQTQSPLVTYYDLLMCMAAERDKCQLSMLNYRMCVHAHSTLEQRLLQQHYASETNNNKTNSNYIRIIKSRRKNEKGNTLLEFLN